MKSEVKNTGSEVTNLGQTSKTLSISEGHKPLLVNRTGQTSQNQANEYENLEVTKDEIFQY